MPRKIYLAEIIATFTLVFFGCGAMVVNDIYNNLGGIGVCTVWGLVVMVMIYAFGNVSSAHMNPARSLGPALVSGQFDGIWIYIVAPITGALLAYPSCRWIQGDDLQEGEPE